MNKKGGWGSPPEGWGELLRPLIVILIFGLILFAIYSVSQYVSPQPENQGLIAKTGRTLMEKLDPGFNFLFGKNIEDSVKWVIGMKSGWATFWDFFYYGGIACLAVFYILIIQFFLNLFLAVIPMKNEKIDYWQRFGILGAGSALKFLAVIIIYPTLMSIGIVNQIIKILTFYWFTGFGTRALVLAIYVFFLPAIISTIIKYVQIYRANQAILKAREGAEMMKAAAG